MNRFFITCHRFPQNLTDFSNRKINFFERSLVNFMTTEKPILEWQAYKNSCWNFCGNPMGNHDWSNCKQLNNNVASNNHKWLRMNMDVGTENSWNLGNFALVSLFTKWCAKKRLVNLEEVNDLGRWAISKILYSEKFLFITLCAAVLQLQRSYVAYKSEYYSLRF